MVQSCDVMDMAAADSLKKSSVASLGYVALSELFWERLGLSASNITFNTLWEGLKVNPTFEISLHPQTHFKK